ncbi:MAG: hypothetical protein RMK99_00625 [Anaerolineales bacterium]|nr:hypothetical protein [Anaerolineales bacterium]
MFTDHSSILNGVAAGTLSAEEAARRMAADAGAGAGAGGRNDAGRWLHVRVTNLDTGRPRVSINLPLSWVNAVLRLGARYQTKLAGLDLDWEEIVALLQSEASGQIIEVEDLDGGQRVEVFVD